MKQLARYIETRDKRIFKKRAGLSIYKKRVSSLWDELVEKGEVVVGGRATCGQSNGDITWDIYTSFGEVVTKAQKLGWSIRVERLPVKQRYATLAGGFWEEKKFTLLEVAGEKQ